ncbi:MAG: alpha/beta hydrolase, partial [Acidimicrobiia bacterium]
MSRRLCVLFVALAVASVAWVSPSSAAEAAGGLSAWRACGAKLQCAMLRVPVDYARPDDEQFGIAVIRHRATDANHRLGSLVINFGGPGDAGTASLPDFVSTVPDEIRARYDLVSFDPRGTGHSRPIQCIDDKTNDALNAIDPTPNSDAD